MIKIRYSSVDGFSKPRSFKSLKGARYYAQQMVGKNPEIGGSYAISGDGIGKIEAEGVAVAELFGDEKPASKDDENEPDDDRRRIMNEVFVSRSGVEARVREELLAFIYAKLRERS